MYSVYLRHFCDQLKAENAFNEVEKYLDAVDNLDRKESFAKIETNTPNTYTLYVQVVEPKITDKNYSQLIDLLSKDYFTHINNDDDVFALKINITKKRETDKYYLKNDITFNYPEADEPSFIPLLKKLIIFSNYFYNIQKFHNRGITAFQEIVQLDEEIQNTNKWKLPTTVDDAVLGQIETWLEIASRNYYKIAANHNLIHTHTKNIEKIVSWIEKHHNIRLDIEDYTIIEEELELKHLNSEAVYKRVKDLKDITLGKTEVGIQRYSNRIQQTAVIIEAFIVYAYTYYIWVHVNEEGLINTPLLLKLLIPLMVAIGVVLAVEFARELDYGWLEWLNRNPKFKKITFFIAALVLIGFGIWYISLSH